MSKPGSPSVFLELTFWPSRQHSLSDFSLLGPCQLVVHVDSLVVFPGPGAHVLFDLACTTLCFLVIIVWSLNTFVGLI